MADELIEPLKPDGAKPLIRQILGTGRFTYSRHAKEEMLADGRRDRISLERRIGCRHSLEGEVLSGAVGGRADNEMH